MKRQRRPFDRVGKAESTGMKTHPAVGGIRAVSIQPVSNDRCVYMGHMEP